MKIVQKLLAIGACVVASLMFAGSAEAQSFGQTQKDREKPLEVDVFWSMRSPYCYISLDRCLEIPEKYNVKLNLRIVYPIAIHDPSFFEAAKMMKYRLPYQNVDLFRTAAFHHVQLVYPTPDPVAQMAAKDSPYGKILPFDQQKDIQFLCRTAVAAAEMGKGWDYLNEVMRCVWNGQKVPWNKDNYKHVRAAINAAGIDADKLIADVQANPEKYDKMIEGNQDTQLENDAQHTGVPNFVFRNEPFFGQDRMAMLIWRLKQHGLTERPDYKPSLRAGITNCESD
jgi:2-hydroxychromene-2-carboxylate isomerase